MAAVTNATVSLTLVNFISGRSEACDPSVLFSSQRRGSRRGLARIGRGVDIRGARWPKAGDLQYDRLVASFREVRSVRRLGINAPRRQSLDTSRIEVIAVAKVPR